MYNLSIVYLLKSTVKKLGFSLIRSCHENALKRDIYSLFELIFSCLRPQVT